MFNRVRFAHYHVDTPREATEKMYFKNQYNTIHIDEKWFFMTRLNRKEYLTQNEEPMAKAVKNKNFIPKIMFLAAVARPQKYPPRQSTNLNLEDSDDDDGEEWYFDGKVGLYPIVETKVTKRRSAIRPAGVVETIPLNVNLAVFEHYVLHVLLPDIATKCPPKMRRERIYIQLDNASPHCIDRNKFKAKCVALGLDCRLWFQRCD